MKENEETQAAYNIEGKPLSPSPDAISSAMYSYIMTDKTLDEVSETYGVDRRYLGKICMREGWTRQKKALGTRLRQLVLASMVERETIRRAAAVQTRESYRIQKKIEQLEADHEARRQNNPDGMSMGLWRDYASAYSALYTELRKALGIADKVAVQADIFALLPTSERTDALKRYRQIAPETERITADSLITDAEVLPAEGGVDQRTETPPPQGNDRGVGTDRITPSQTSEISKPHSTNDISDAVDMIRENYVNRYANG